MATRYQTVEISIFGPQGNGMGKIAKWYVKPGDSVSRNQGLCEVLGSAEGGSIPSPSSGKVYMLFFEEGTELELGTSIMMIDSAPQ